MANNLGVFRRGFTQAFTTTRVVCFVMTLLGGFVYWKWPGAAGQITWLGWVVPMIVLEHSFFWQLSRAFLLKNYVGEVRDKKELEDAISVYGRMPPHERHTDEEIRQWFRDEKERNRKELGWREIFLVAREQGVVWRILFATFSNGFLNIYAYAENTCQLPGVDREKLDNQLLKALDGIIETLPVCEGLLVELSDERETEGLSIAVKKRGYDGKLRKFGPELELVTPSFFFPDFTSQKRERTVSLFFARNPHNAMARLDPQRDGHARKMIAAMYSIYRGIREDLGWRSYIDGLEPRTLASLSSPAPTHFVD